MRTVGLAAAALGITLVLAQDAVPAWAGFHAWQYAAMLAIDAAAIAGYVQAARKGEDGEPGRRLVVAMAGAFVIVAAGLASGLLGPDTETVARPPGTVVPLPDAGVAAFFPNAGPDEVARGDAHVLLRRRTGAALELGAGERRYVGAAALSLSARPAAYVDARDPRGRHVTITQPANAAFLSPVLLFGQEVAVAGKTLPADAFATPALHRQIKAFFFSKTASAAARSGHSVGAHEAVLFAVDDDAGRLMPGGIGFARSGEDVSLGGVRLRATIGSYPALVVSAVPYPPALWAGGLLFALGLAYAVGPRAAGARRRPAVA